MWELTWDLGICRATLRILDWQEILNELVIPNHKTTTVGS